MADRCTGRCCEDFYLSYGPEDLEILTPDEGDSLIIKRMVLYLGFYKETTDPKELAGHHYTCRHYNKKTHDCEIYDRRPRMCRDYPYNKPCKFKGCELTPELMPDVLVSMLVRKRCVVTRVGTGT